MTRNLLSSDSVSLVQPGVHPIPSRYPLQNDPPTAAVRGRVPAAVHLSYNDSIQGWITIPPLP
jgi:hypothetical protein